MSGIYVKVDGLRDLERSLDELSRAAAKGAVKRTLKKAGEPVAQAYANGVRRRSGALAESATVSDKLSRRQKQGRQKQADVEMFIGPGALTQAITEEFGTPSIAPQGELRKAWDAEARPTLDRIANGMAEEVAKSVKRAEARAKRLASKGMA